MASTGKYIHYRLPFILVVISFILISAWQFFLQRDIGAVFTWEWIPICLSFLGYCLWLFFACTKSGSSGCTVFLKLCAL